MHCNVWCMKQRPLWLLTTKEWMPFHNPFLSGIKDTRNLKLFTAAIDELLSLKNASNELFSIRKKWNRGSQCCPIWADVGLIDFAIFLTMYSFFIFCCFTCLGLFAKIWILQEVTSIQIEPFDQLNPFVLTFFSRSALIFSWHPDYTDLVVSHCRQRIEKIVSLVLKRIVNFSISFVSNPVFKGFISNSFLICF